MAGRGPLPKPKGQRQRRNKSSEPTVIHALTEEEQGSAPELHERDGGWHPFVVEWWRDVWASEMAPQYLSADVSGGLRSLAELYQRRWTADTISEELRICQEIRLQEHRFGLSPKDRYILKWEVDKGEEAERRTKSRRHTPAPKPDSTEGDPRSALKAI
jgi:hypothetical protein